MWMQMIASVWFLIGILCLDFIFNVTLGMLRIFFKFYYLLSFFILLSFIIFLWVIWRFLKIPSGCTFSTVQFSSVLLLSCVRLFVTPWIAACQASLSITISGSSLKLMSIESVMPSSHLILCRPLLLQPCPQSLPASESFPMSQFFTWGGQSTRVSASASVLPMNAQDWSPLEWTGWMDLLAVQGTLKNLPQHHSSKASILHHSAFFTVQLSHDHRKNHSLD